MTAAVTASGKQRRQAQAGHDAQVQASWQQRALNVEEALKAAHTEIGTQRERIGSDLTDEARPLSEKLQAARPNNRFPDKRIADLETQLLECERSAP